MGKKVTPELEKNFNSTKLPALKWRKND